GAVGLPHERAAAEGPGAEAVRGPEGLDQAHQPGERGGRPRHPGEDRRGQEPHDPELRLLRDLLHGRAELRGVDLRAWRREGLMDPRFPSATFETNGTAAKLLVKLMQALATDQPMAVLTRALGMLEQAVAARGQGRRLGVYDPKSGAFTDLVI